MNNPAPSNANPFRRVRFSRVTVTPGCTWNTRSSEPASMMVVPALTPRMIRFPVISRSPRAALSSNVPPMVNWYRPASSTMTSSPGEALLSMMAARRVVSPVIAAATASPGLVSGRSLNELTALSSTQTSDFVGTSVVGFAGSLSSSRLFSVSLIPDPAETMVSEYCPASAVSVPRSMVYCQADSAVTVSPFSETA